MLASDRRNRIRELLIEYAHVDVSSLCAFLRVSPATVRRDLDILEREGFLIKTYGGAVLNEHKENDGVRLSSAAPYDQEQKTLAAFAVNLVEEGSVIYLGKGAICTHMARLLRMCPRLSVVTGNVLAAIELADAPGINTVLVGGDLICDGSSIGTSGEAAREAVRRMYFNQCFVSFDGASLKRGFTVDNMNRSGVIQAALENSDARCALLDSSIIGKTSLYSVAELNALDKIVAPMQMPEAFKEYFLTNNLRLYDVAMN